MKSDRKKSRPDRSAAAGGERSRRSGPRKASFTPGNFFGLGRALLSGPAAVAGAIFPKAGGALSGRRLKLPVLEVVLLLLLVKIGAGAWVLLSGPETAVQAPPLEISEKFEAPEEARASLGRPGAGFEAGAAPSEAAETRLNSLLTLVSPSVAEASAPAAASALSAAPFASGAIFAITGQSASPPMAQGGAEESIPLPPGADLRTPAAELPPPSLPSLGPGLSGQSAPPAGASGGSRSAAPLPPNAVPASAGALQQREQALALKEAELASREEALRNLDVEIRQRLAAIENFRRESEESIQRNEAVLAELKALKEEQQKEDEMYKDARVQHQVTAYKRMKPEQAGNLVNNLDDESAVTILAAMPGSSAGLILANVNPEKAARLTKAILERRIDPNLIMSDNAAGSGQPLAP